MNFSVKAFLLSIKTFDILEILVFNNLTPISQQDEQMH